MRWPPRSRPSSRDKSRARGAAAWAGGLIALSPIHVLASRTPGPEAPWFFFFPLPGPRPAGAEWSGRPRRRRAPRPFPWASWRRAAWRRSWPSAVCRSCGFSCDERRVAAVRPGERGPRWSPAASPAGLARSPLDFGEIPTSIPEATASGILRCTGASFTRVAGLEYHLAVSHARYVIPLTALFVGLMAWGAARLPARARAFRRGRRRPVRARRQPWRSPRAASCRSGRAPARRPAVRRRPDGRRASRRCEACCAWAAGAAVLAPSSRS